MLDFSSRSLPTRGDVSQSLDQSQALFKNVFSCAPKHVSYHLDFTGTAI